MLLVVVGGFIKWTVVDHGAALGPLGLWPNIYDVRFLLTFMLCVRLISPPPQHVCSLLLFFCCCAPRRYFDVLHWQTAAWQWSHGAELHGVSRHQPVCAMQGTSSLANSPLSPPGMLSA